jgi:hypothetical protein
MLVLSEGANNMGTGFDPTYLGPLSGAGSRLQFERRFYDETCSAIPADVVICRHVIEHIDHPVQFLQTIHNALTPYPNARLFFETPSLEWIFQNQVIWDFFYEHASYFTAGSLTSAFERAGFTVQSVTQVFDGQYLWLEAINTVPLTITLRPGNVDMLAEEFGRYYSRRIGALGETVRTLASHHKLAIWGAAAKGATFANLIDPNRAYIAAVVDINPAKQFGFIPGTGHPIIPPDQLRDDGITTAIVLNPNYLVEVQRWLQENQLSVELINLGGSDC